MSENSGAMRRAAAIRVVAWGFFAVLVAAWFLLGRSSLPSPFVLFAQDAVVYLVPLSLAVLGAGVDHKLNPARHVQPRARDEQVDTGIGQLL